MEEIETVEALLTKVNKINDEHEKRLMESGEGFNIFKILALSTNEVRTHSAFIAELLNPNGSHRQGSIFLDLFLKSISTPMNFNLSKTIVKTEHWIGYINDEQTEGGYIDLIISDDQKNTIIIENKINAGDQKNQVLRYRNYAPSAIIYYLTLFGDKPSAFSTNNQPINYRLISYNKDIIKWLDECMSNTLEKFFLYHAISHYKDLIEILTKKKTNIMRENIFELFKASGNLKAAKIIHDEYDKFEYEIKSYCYNKVFEKWKEKYKSDGQSIDIFTVKKEYKFYTRISNEGDKLHLEIFPGEDKFGRANDESISLIRKIATEYARSLNTFNNKNYTIWIYFKNNFENMQYDEFANFYDKTNQIKWVEDIMIDAEFFLKNFIKALRDDSRINEDLQFTENSINFFL